MSRWIIDFQKENPSGIWGNSSGDVLFGIAQHNATHVVEKKDHYDLTGYRMRAGRYTPEGMPYSLKQSIRFFMRPPRIRQHDEYSDNALYVDCFALDAEGKPYLYPSYLETKTYLLKRDSTYTSAENLGDFNAFENTQILYQYHHFRFAHYISDRDLNLTTNPERSDPMMVEFHLTDQQSDDAPEPPAWLGMRGAYFRREGQGEGDHLLPWDEDATADEALAVAGWLQEHRQGK